MRIDSFELYTAKLELKKPFITSLGVIESSDHIFLKVISENGEYGWGECAPAHDINGETIETCLSISKKLTDSIIGTSFFSHDVIHKKLNSVIYGNQSIKSAIDVACYDLASKSKNVPLFRYLGGELKKKIYTDYTVSLNDLDKMVEQSIEIINNGFKIIKVKLGDNGKKDVERIKAIRECIGKDIQIRIDANQGWDVDEAIEALNNMNKYNIEYCEEPINRDLSFRLGEVKMASPINIMADESLFTSYDAEMMIHGNHCDMFNLKIGKHGGLYESNKIIKIAEKNNIPMQVGGFIESKIIFTVNCHLGHTSDLIKFFDCDSPLFHKKNPILGGIDYKNDWELVIPNSNGIGINLDLDFLKNCSKII